MKKIRHYLTECSAAFADLGTFLPLVLGLIVVAGMEPVGLFFGFGLFAILTACVYRRPIPVQPMKAVAAMGIAGLISVETLVATGLLIGVFLIALSQTPWIGWLKRCIPNTVLYGMRLALGFSLIGTALSFASPAWVAVLLLLALLVALQFTRFAGLGCIAVLVVGYLWLGTVPEAFTWTVTWSSPAWTLPSLQAFQASLTTALLPQIALTLTNALILTAVVAKDYFPDDPSVHDERRYALSSGIVNLALAPFGAMPMCHGAGGLAAHYGMGSRSGLALGVFGVVCITMALLVGPQITHLLSTVPVEVVTPLVMYGAWVLADPPALIKLKPSCRVIIAAMVPITLLYGLMPALLFGVLAEHLRMKLAIKQAA